MDHFAKAHRREVHNLDLSDFETGTTPHDLWAYPGARNADENSEFPLSVHVPDLHGLHGERSWMFIYLFQEMM